MFRNRNEKFVILLFDVIRSKRMIIMKLKLFPLGINVFLYAENISNLWRKKCMRANMGFECR